MDKKKTKKIFLVSILLLTKDGDLVIKRSADSRYAPGKWNSPGGHVEPGESDIDAAIRELNEETGIRTSRDELVRLDLVKGIKERDTDGNPFEIDYQRFMLRLPDTFKLKQIKQSKESSGVKVIGLKELKQYAEHPEQFEDEYVTGGAPEFLHKNWDMIVSVCKGAVRSFIPKP